jgi:hypothetical protein
VHRGVRKHGNLSRALPGSAEGRVSNLVSYYLHAPSLTTHYLLLTIHHALLTTHYLLGELLPARALAVPVGEAAGAAAVRLGARGGRSLPRQSARTTRTLCGHEPGH